MQSKNAGRTINDIYIGNKKIIIRLSDGSRLDILPFTYTNNYLFKGKELSDEDISLLKKDDEEGKLIDAANKILAKNNVSVELMKEKLSWKCFDNEIVEKTISYLKEHNLLNDYEKVLKQRNAYLKVMYANANKSQTYLDILTDKLIDYGLKIYKKRVNFIEQINKYIGDFYSKISGIGTLKIKYQSELKDKNQEKLKKMYNSLKDKDMLLGNTTLGVHKDDYAFCFESESLKDYASQGQQKNAIIAYKLSLIELFKNERNIKPILILDDLFSELDNEKINNILEVIDKDLQIFITVTDLNKLPSYIKDKDNKIFNCGFGEIREDIWEN